MIARQLSITALSFVAGLSASACGFNANTRVKSGQVWTEITTPGRAIKAPPPKAAPTQPSKAKVAVVAVFDVEDRGLGLTPALRERLSAYIAITLAAGGRFHVVPRSDLKKRLRKQKHATYRKCFDQSCQIEIGRELAAQKTLATVIMKVGSRCTVTAVLYDLKKAASEGGATQESKCDTDAIVDAIKKLVAKLGTKR